MKSYVNPVHLVTTRDGVCPDGHVEVQMTMGGESATEFLLTETQDRIRALEAALRYWLPDEQLIPKGHEIAWNSFYESAPRARQVKGMEAYETQSVGGLLCGGSDMGERPTQGARQQRRMRSHACEDVTVGETTSWSAPETGAEHDR